MLRSSGSIPNGTPVAMMAFTKTPEGPLWFSRSYRVTSSASLELLLVRGPQFFSRRRPSGSSRQRPRTPPRASSWSSGRATYCSMFTTFMMSCDEGTIPTSWRTGIRNLPKAS